MEDCLGSISSDSVVTVTADGLKDPDTACVQDKWLFLSVGAWEEIVI